MIFLHGQLGYMDEVAWVLGAILVGIVLLSTAVSHWQTHSSHIQLSRKIIRQEAK